MKKTKKKIFIYIFIFIIIITFLYNLKDAIVQKDNFQDDFIFFKFLNHNDNQKQEIDKKTIQYELKISKGEEKSKKINLLNTVDEKTLVNEKVAPGTKGKFDILISSLEDIKYEIEIVDKNEKPKNLKLSIENGQNGELNKNEIKTVEVNWEWCYEINYKENEQDTRDGEKIKLYNFEIIVIGK